MKQILSELILFLQKVKNTQRNTRVLYFTSKDVGVVEAIFFVHHRSFAVDHHHAQFCFGALVHGVTMQW